MPLVLIRFYLYEIFRRRARRTLSVVELRRSARKPYRQLNSNYYADYYSKEPPMPTRKIDMSLLPAALQIQPVPLTAPTASPTKAAAATGRIKTICHF